MKPPCSVRRDPVAVAPDARKPLEVRGVILLRRPGRSRSRPASRGTATCRRARRRPSASGCPLDRRRRRPCRGPAPESRRARPGVRIAADEAAHDVGAAGDRREVHVRLDRAIDEIEALGRERRSRRRDRAERRQRCVSRGTSPPCATASMNFADVPNSVMPTRSASVEQPVRVRVKRRSVVQDDRRLRREHRHEPVPHHPAARREVEDAVVAPDVAVELMFLQVLQERAAGAVHDALRHAGRAGRIEDVERMVERQRRERRVAGVVRRRASPSSATAPWIAPRSLVALTHGTITTRRTARQLRRRSPRPCRRQSCVLPPY